MHPLQRRSFLQLAALSFPAQLLAQATGTVHTAQTTPANTPADGLPPLVHAGEDRYAFPRNVPNGSSTFKVAAADAHNGLFVMEHHHNRQGRARRVTSTTLKTNGSMYWKAITWSKWGATS